MSTHRDLCVIINRIAATLWLGDGYQVDEMEMKITNSGGSAHLATLRLIPGEPELQVTWEQTGETEDWPRLPNV
jgi:hypothetical protein